MNVPGEGKSISQNIAYPELPIVFLRFVAHTGQNLLVCIQYLLQQKEHFNRYHEPWFTFKISRVIAFFSCWYNFADFQNSDTVEVTAQREHWEYKVIEKKKGMLYELLFSGYTLDAWGAALHLMHKCLYRWTPPYQCNLLLINLLFGFCNYSHNNNNASPHTFNFALQKE